MKLKKIRILYFAISIIVIFITACTSKQSEIPLPDSEAAFNYIKGLEGKWVVQGGKEGVFGWEFVVTSRGGVIVERLKVGTPTEMTTVYHLDNGVLVGNHYCQLQNQPNLTAVTSETEGDLHFLCNVAALRQSQKSNRRTVKKRFYVIYRHVDFRNVCRCDVCWDLKKQDG